MSVMHSIGECCHGMLQKQNFPHVRVRELWKIQVVSLCVCYRSYEFLGLLGNNDKLRIDYKEGRKSRAEWDLEHIIATILKSMQLHTAKNAPKLQTQDIKFIVSRSSST